MDAVSVVLIAIGLAMDAFAVSISCGISDPHKALVNAIRAGIAFGFFQGAMTSLGWLVGFSFRNYIEAVDHWIAFGLLLIIGGKMIKDALNPHCKPVKLTSNKMLITLAVATSIDAMAAGVSISALNVNIALPALSIGLITLLFSFVGVFIGKIVGKANLGKFVDILGGLILIGIGIKILIENLLA